MRKMLLLVVGLAGCSHQMAACSGPYFPLNVGQFQQTLVEQPHKAAAPVQLSSTSALTAVEPVSPKPPAPTPPVAPIEITSPLAQRIIAAGPKVFDPPPLYVHGRPQNALLIGD